MWNMPIDIPGWMGYNDITSKEYALRIVSERQGADLLSAYQKIRKSDDLGDRQIDRSPDCQIARSPVRSFGHLIAR